MHLATPVIVPTKAARKKKLLSSIKINSYKYLLIALYNWHSIKCMTLKIIISSSTGIFQTMSANLPLKYKK